VTTANNPVISTEIARRSIRIRMNAKDERPHLRSQFHHPDLVLWTVANRGRLVGAVLTLCRAWIAAGQPTPTGQRLGSFEAWSDVIGGILMTAGIPGFLGNLVDFYDRVDDEGAAWRQFIDDWWTAYGPNSQPAGALLRQAQAAGIELSGHTDEKQAASLGRELKKQLDNIFGGLTVRPGERLRGKGTTYRLDPIDGREWTPPDPEPENVAGWPSRVPANPFTVSSP
jgi:hypothetical protein